MQYYIVVTVYAIVKIIFLKFVIWIYIYIYIYIYEIASIYWNSLMLYFHNKLLFFSWLTKKWKKKVVVFKKYIYKQFEVIVWYHVIIESIGTSYAPSLVMSI